MARGKGLPRESGIRRIFSFYVNSAKKRKIKFSLSYRTFRKLIFLNCFYCGIEPSNIFKERGYKARFNYNGLDRVDNDKGYFLKNLVPCCFKCNGIKTSKVSKDEMIVIGRAIRQYSLLQLLKKHKSAQEQSTPAPSTRRRPKAARR